jgi:multiple sugar transport system permease protein
VTGGPADRRGGGPTGDTAHHGPPARRPAGPPVVTWALTLLLALTMLAPFLWMVSTSLMGELEVFQVPPRLLPADPHWENYVGALTARPFGRYFLNSLIFALVVVTGQLATAATAGYAFARLEFKGRDRLFLLVLSTMMVPTVVVLIPRFLMIDALGWVDTYTGLAGTELVSVWGIFLLRQYFRTVPRELEDAARMDGAGPWRIFWSVSLPLAKPALATLGLFAFIEAWKSLLWPLIATRSMAMRTVEVGIASFHGVFVTNWPYQMAAAVTAVVPVLVLFVFTQRYFVRGIQMTGFK